jgi:hypothetical protein
LGRLILFNSRHADLDVTRDNNIGVRTRCRARVHKDSTCAFDPQDRAFLAMHPDRVAFIEEFDPDRVKYDPTHDVPHPVALASTLRVPP